MILQVKDALPSPGSSEFSAAAVWGSAVCPGWAEGMGLRFRVQGSAFLFERLFPPGLFVQGLGFRV